MLKKSDFCFDDDNNGGLKIQQHRSPSSDYDGKECYDPGYNSRSPSGLSDNISDYDTLSCYSRNTHGYKSDSSCSLDYNGIMQKEFPPTSNYCTNMPLSMCLNNKDITTLGVYHRDPCLIFKTAPEHRFRYRYDTEMSGTHGSLQGIRSHMEKSVPEVGLVNYTNEALIRVSVVTCNEIGKRYPHPHNLFVKEKMYQKNMYENIHNKSLTKTGHYSDPHYIRVGVNGVDDFTARFEGMCIISSKKENFSASIREKLEMRMMEQGLREANEKDLLKEVEEAVKLVDLDFVSLCFEAFREEQGRLIPICPPLYSERIGNAKSANTGKLKISRINKCSGSCKGGEEIWMLVEKINKKGLVIRFFEEYNGEIQWEYCIEGDDIILHHQYAIIFKTPPYKDPNISSEVKVLMRLERMTQLSPVCNFSEPITFVYEPLKNKHYKSDSLYKKESIISQSMSEHVKRPRMDTSAIPGINIHYKRKRDEQECSSLDDMVDIDKILSENQINLAEFSPSYPKFWDFGPDFEQYISEIYDSPFQKDGVHTTAKSRKKDLFQLLHYMYSKLDENEIKKLTDRINNMGFSRTKTKQESEVGDEKKEMEDAVSTLLSLREKAVELSNRKKEMDRNDCDTLHEAVLQNNPEALRRIMSNGGSWERDDDYNNPLHLSLILRRDTCTETLLQFRKDMSANINDKNKEGRTPLHIATANGNLRHVKLLLECGANVNITEEKTKRNALHIAVAEKYRDVAEYLIKDSDILLDTEDADGETPASLVKLLSVTDRIHFEKLFNKRKIKGEDNPAVVKNCKDVNLDELFRTLNESGSWRILAEMCNCSELIPCAEESENPTKCIFSCSEQLSNEMELQSLRNLLDAINEKKGLVVLDEILARKLFLGKS